MASSRIAAKFNLKRSGKVMLSIPFPLGDVMFIGVVDFAVVRCKLHRLLRRRRHRLSSCSRSSRDTIAELTLAIIFTVEQFKYSPNMKEDLSVCRLSLSSA